MAFSSMAKEAFPEGWILISIPWDKIRAFTESLKKMTWAIPAYAEGREKFMEHEARCGKRGWRRRRDRLHGSRRM